jgi:predicted outer membrane repeat protein
VFVAGGSLSLNGPGTIRDNNASGNGGGVYFESGTFYMIGNNITVSISGNTATGNGGGVYVANGSFDWGNSYVTSSIGDNNATNGGGVYVAGGSFLLQGEAKISGNTATTNGGGVYVGGGSFTKLTDTIIYGDDASPGQKNTAGSGNGHAAYVTDGPKRRNSTAGTLVGLDSATSGPPGGWDGSSGYIQSEIDSASPGGTITLPAGTYDMTGKVTVDKNIIITTETGAEVILKRNSSFTGGMIEADVTTDGLTLKAGTGGSLTLDGNGSMVTAESHLVKVAAGDLTIESGVTLRGNKITDPGIGGSGVYFSGGTFTMSGGTIGGSGADKNTAGASGGGVFVNAGTFNMSDGTISGNESSTGNGGGVYFAGAIFNMTGGTISGNKASSGGGVYFAGTTFNMSGGTIGGSGEGNQAVNGGGVYVNNGTFEMSGGTIHGNTATSSGGGVYVESGQFIMTGGTISGNKATSGEGPGGGGVYVDSGGTFQKKDTANPGDSGTIYGNTGDSNGNIANGGNNGHAVYVPVGGLKRNSTADPSVNLDSSNTTNWE